MLNTPAARIDSLPPLYGGGGGMTPGGNTPASTRDHQAPKFIVGNALAGDTIDVCDYLDTGNGVQAQAALTQAGVVNGGNGADVHLRPGVYTLTAGPLSVPTMVKLSGGGMGTIITPSASDRRALILASYADLTDLLVVVNTPAALSTGSILIQFASGCTLRRVSAYQTYATNLTNMTNEALRYFVRSPSSSALAVLENLDLTLPDFQSVALAQNMVGVSSSNGSSENTPVMMTNVRVVGGDRGLECAGNALITGCSIQSARRRGMHLSALTFDSRHHVVNGCRVFMGFATEDYAGIEIDTGTLATGTRSTTIIGTEVRATTGANVTSTGIRLTGTGDGAILSAVEISSFPRGLTVSALQANVSAKGVIRGATTPVTDASGSLLNEMRVI